MLRTVVVFTAVLVLSVSVWGNTAYYVPDDFNSISEAVAAAEIFDTVVVRAGTYFENIVIPHSNFTVRSEKGAEETIIRSEDAGDGAAVFTLLSTYTRITGFTVEGNSGGIGIELDGAGDGYITNNIISGNKYGVYLKSGSRSNVVANNEIKRNSKGGIVVDNSLKNVVMDNTLSDNGIGAIILGSSDGGSVKSQCSDNTVRYNQFVKNEVGMAVRGGAGNYVYLNDFLDNRLACQVFSGKNNKWHTPKKRGYMYNGASQMNYLGNFWGDYRGVDGNGDGVCDKAYDIGAAQDKYPLMKQVEDMGAFLYTEWSKEYKEVSCVAAIDINKDGIQDFITATHDEIRGYVFDGYTYSEVWRKKGGADSIAVGDLTGDGIPEVVLGRWAITVLDGYSYKVLWQSEKLANRVMSIRIDDVDGDGQIEIVVGTKDSGHVREAYVYIFDGISHELEWKSEDLKGGMRLEVGDVNGDGGKKIVCTTRNGYVYVFDGKTHKQEWKSNDLGGYVRGVVLADIDDEGDKEIIVSNAEGSIYVFDGKSRILKRQWKQPNTGWYSGLAIGDVDNDGVDDLVVGLMIGETLPAHGAGLVYVLDLHSFAIKKQSEMLVQWIGLGGIVVADLDGDWDNEILTTGREQVYIFSK